VIILYDGYRYEKLTLPFLRLPCDNRNSCYIILIGLMKFDSPGVISQDVKRTTIPLILSGLKLWPLAHCVTYGLVPVENRLLWVDTVEILWVTILATQAAGTGAMDEASSVVEEKDP
jgi:Mpv17 / PMP22 family